MIVYLLHFETKVRCCTHYIGSTTEEQFERRMREHWRGSAARLTALAYEQGSKIILARIWEAPDRVLERKLKMAGHYKDKCPICSPALAIALPEPPQVEHLAPIAKTNFRALTF